MDQNSLLIIVAVFTGVAAVALLIQAGVLFGLFKMARAIESKVPKMDGVLPKVEALLPKLEALLPKLEALAESSRKAIDDGSQQIHMITVKTNDILESARKQMARVDEVMEDATVRAHSQLDRAEMVIDDTMNRAQETVALVHSGIMVPLHQSQGVTAGVKAALNFLMRGRNGPVHATADEEMFI
jgi:hypothetical protein